MIIQADKCNYDYAETIKATGDLYDELQKKKNSNFNSYEGLEIVPYAHLWEVVLDCIKE